MSEKTINNNPFHETIRYSWLILGIVLVLGYCIENKIGLRSASLGFVLSAAGFYLLSKSQENLIKTKKTSAVYLSFISRLIVYGLGIGSTIYFHNYFNLVVVLLSLFSFQLFYIISEAIKSIKNIRQEKKNG